MESSSISKPASASPLGTKLDKSKPNLKFPAKFTDVEDNLQDLEKKDLLEEGSSNKRAVCRMSTGEIKKARVVKRARSSQGSRESFNRTRSVSPPKDNLPDFDPKKFTPGYVPKTVKKGDVEYLIVISGVPNTGLCGKYWGDVDSLPSRRRKPTLSPLVATTKTTAKKRTPSMISTPKTTAKKRTQSMDMEKLATFTSTPKTTAKKRTQSMDMEKLATLTSTPKTTAKKKVSFVNVVKTSLLEPERSPKKMADTSTTGDMPGGGWKQKPEQVQMEETPQLKKTAMAPDQGRSMSEKIQKIADPTTKSSRMLRNIQDFNNRGNMENQENNREDPGKTRKTFNSQCGTDVGVFRNKNVDSNDQTASNNDKIVEQETVDTNIKQELPTSDQEEEIQIMKEIVKTPAAVMNIKHEYSTYQPKVIYTENVKKDKGNQSLMQLNKELSGNEQISVRMETRDSTCTDKYPVGTSAFPAKYTSGTSALPANPTGTTALPANLQLLKSQTKTKLDLLSKSGFTITPVGPSKTNSFSSSSEARETTGLPHVGSTRSRGDMTGRAQDGASQDTDESGDTTECANCGPTHQRIRSQGNITVKIEGGDITFNTGGLTTTQIKINGVEMTGPGDDVTNFAIKATRAVRDLVNDN